MSVSEPGNEPFQPFGEFVADILASQAAQTDAQFKRLLAEKAEAQAALEKALEKIKQLREINERLTADLAALRKERTGLANQSS